MHRRLYGRHPLTIGAVILLGLSIYEFWIRFDDFQAWFLGVRHLSEVRGTPFLEDLAIIFEVPEMRLLGFKMMYLAAVIIFAVVCLVRRNRYRMMWLLLILDIAAAAAGVYLEFYAVSSWVQLLKLIPLGLIAAGSISNMAQWRKHRHASRRQYPDNGHYPDAHRRLPEHRP